MPGNNPMDPQSWPAATDLSDVLQTQQRGFDAVVKASRILADAMRACVERHMNVAQKTFDDLVGAAPTKGGGPADEAWRSQTARLQEAMARLAHHMGDMHQLIVDAQLAALSELQGVWSPDTDKSAASAAGREGEVSAAGPAGSGQPSAPPAGPSTATTPRSSAGPAGDESVSGLDKAAATPTPKAAAADDRKGSGERSDHAAARAARKPRRPAAP